MVESGKCCREKNNAGFVHSLSLCLCCVVSSLLFATIKASWIPDFGS